ncbi:MAG: hypothetical protein M1820_003362 [Bogoriella megaspora]|nr:MAG: hypothetical protein M1820_003362 [Bogoriella megaspora]
MENKAEDEIIRRWQAEEQLQKDLIESTAPPRKRRRGDRSDIESVDSETTNMLTNGTSAGAQRPMLEWTDENGGSWKDTNQNGSSTVPKVAKQKLRAPATRGRGGHRK